MCTYGVARRIAVVGDKVRPFGGGPAERFDRRTKRCLKRFLQKFAPVGSRNRDPRDPGTRVRSPIIGNNDGCRFTRPRKFDLGGNVGW